MLSRRRFLAAGAGAAGARAARVVRLGRRGDERHDLDERRRRRHRVRPGGVHRRQRPARGGGGPTADRSDRSRRARADGRRAGAALDAGRRPGRPRVGSRSRWRAGRPACRARTTRCARPSPGAGAYEVRADVDGAIAVLDDRAAAAGRGDRDPPRRPAAEPGHAHDHRCDGRSRPICTAEPRCPLHTTSLDAAVAAGGPVALLVSTPKFCQVAICGPVLDVLLTRVERHPGIRVRPRRGVQEPRGQHHPTPRTWHR